MESKLITSECKHYICPGEMIFYLFIFFKKRRWPRLISFPLTTSVCLSTLCVSCPGDIVFPSADWWPKYFLNQDQLHFFSATFYHVCVCGLVLKYPLYDTHENTQTPILKCAFKNNGPWRYATLCTHRACFKSYGGQYYGSSLKAGGAGGCKTSLQLLHVTRCFTIAPLKAIERARAI